MRAPLAYRSWFLQRGSPGAARRGTMEVVPSIMSLT
jgi:hypothetical protein